MSIPSIFNIQNFEWMDKANCKDAENPDVFFPPREKALYKQIADEAKEFCFGKNGNNPCPVRLNCLIFAINEDEEHGIWGGLSHRERNALVRKWQRLYKNEMSLQDYILKINMKGKKHGSIKK
jgi:WhiB family redox-sensing transcriptional regulator